jgi:hypothetical protein
MSIIAKQVQTIRTDRQWLNGDFVTSCLNDNPGSDLVVGVYATCLSARGRIISQNLNMGSPTLVNAAVLHNGTNHYSALVPKGSAHKVEKRVLHQLAFGAPDVEHGDSDNEPNVIVSKAGVKVVDVSDDDWCPNSASCSDMEIVQQSEEVVKNPRCNMSPCLLIVTPY